MNFGKDPNDDYENDDMDSREDFDFEDDESEGGLLRWVSLLFVLAAIGGFAALAWYAYKSGMQPVSEDEIPYVAAVEEPLKEKPEEPGGWQFEHQDKSVYNQLAAGREGQERPVAERLLPAPEEPVERPEAEQVVPEEFQRETVSGTEVPTPIPSTPAKEAEPVEEETVSETLIAPTPAPEPEAPVEEQAAIEEAPVAESKPEPKPAPAAEPAPTPAPSAANGRWMAQLGAFGSDEDARAAWGKISAAHGSRLQTSNYTVERADLGAKGVFHRLQMGPFGSEAEVRKVCEYLEQNRQGCFVVKK